MKVLNFLMVMGMIQMQINDEEFEGEGDKKNPENVEIQSSENMENDKVNTKQPTDLVLLRKINDIDNDVRK